MSEDEQPNSPWNVLKRVVMGKPAFLEIDVWKQKTIDASGRLKRRASKVLPSKPLPEPVVAKNASAVPVAVNPLRDSQGNKILPELTYQRYDDHISGDNLELWLQFKNTSNVPLEVCYVELFNTRTSLCTILSPNVVKKMCAYSGPMPQSTKQSHARIVYRELLSGIKDVFCGEYVVLFQQFHDSHHYTIHGLSKDGPTRNW